MKFIIVGLDKFTSSSPEAELLFVSLQESWFLVADQKDCNYCDWGMGDAITIVLQIWEEHFEYWTRQVLLSTSQLTDLCGCMATSHHHRSILAKKRNFACLSYG